VMIILGGLLAVNNYTYFTPPPPKGIEESGKEKRLPKKNYKKKKTRKAKDKGFILKDFSKNCGRACGTIKESQEVRAPKINY
jgi:hypothetical protein